MGVILNLAIWFAVHSLFHATRHAHGSAFSFDAPDVPASLNVWALALAVGCRHRVFRFKAGMLPTLAASCAGGGVALYALGLVSPL